MMDVADADDAKEVKVFEERMNAFLKRPGVEQVLRKTRDKLLADSTVVHDGGTGHYNHRIVIVRDSPKGDTVPLSVQRCIIYGNRCTINWCCNLIYGNEAQIHSWGLFVLFRLLCDCYTIL